jgi:hypothetical protein
MFYVAVSLLQKHWFIVKKQGFSFIIIEKWHIVWRIIFINIQLHRRFGMYRRQWVIKYYFFM